MIIEKPRALPRVVIATLALGGPSLLAGCGGGGGSPSIADAGMPGDAGVDAVQAFCNAKVSCGYSGTAAACDSYYNAQLSYYDTACQGAIRNALACIANVGCNGNPAGCQSAISNVIGSCFSVDSAVADRCAQQNMCGQGGLANAKSCASSFSTNEGILSSNYGPNCLTAYDALLECISQLACGTTRAYGCPTQLTDYQTYCR